MLKMYIFVDKELTRSQKAVQACHAVAEYMHEYGQLESTQKWVKEFKTMVILSTDDFEKIFKNLNGLNFSYFHEDDLDGRLTAIAIEPTDDYSRFKDFRLI